MSRMYRPSEIANLIEQSLNDISIQLYDSGEISDKIVFNVTADEQTYIRMQKAEYQINDYQEFTPIIIYRQDRYQYPADYLRYQETYDIQVYGYNSQLTSLETIFKHYTVLENTDNKSVTLDTFRITKEVTDISFGEPIEPQDGTLDERVIGSGAFTWTFLDGVMTSYDVMIQIDGIEIPYIQYSYVDTSRLIPNKTINTTGYTNIKGSNYYGISLLIPYIKTSPKIVELYNDFYNRKYNKKYTLTYIDDAGVTFSYDVVMQEKSFVDTRTSILEFAVTFIRVEETVTLQINDIDISLLTYSINSEAQLLPNQNINEDYVKSAVTGSNYVINMDIDISDSANTITEELLGKVLNQDFNTPYRITFTKRNITYTYDVILQNGSYQFDTNPDDRISLTFVRYDEDLVTI